MSDFYFLGLQDGAQKGEADAMTGMSAIPNSPINFNMFDVDYNRGFMDGYYAAHDITRRSIDDRATQLKAERLRWLEERELGNTKDREQS